MPTQHPARSRGARRPAALLALALAVAACGDAATAPPPLEVAQLEVTGGDSQWAEPGGVLGEQLRVRAVDSRGTPVAGVRVDWSVSAGSITPAGSTTDSDGVATAAWRLGGAPYRQVATARIDRGPIVSFSATTTTSVNAAGRVFTTDGSVPAGLRVLVSSRAGSAAAPIAADGSFSLRATVAGDSVDYIVDAADGARTFHPALVRVPAGTAPDLRIVLVPRRWTIERGTFAGTAVNVSPDLAFRPPCTTTGDTNCDGFFPRVWTTGIKLWPATALPIRLAFDRVRTHAAIAAADSVEFWNIVNRMNDDFGSPLFRPARYEEFSVATDGRPDRAVLVRVDTTLSGFGAWTNWWWDANGEMYAGVVRAARLSLLRSSSLMTHELLHTQGFKHSCSWATVMGGYGCNSALTLFPSDVAHAHLALRVHEVQRQTGAPHGLVAALQGERVVALGLPPFAASDAPRLRMLRGDEIMHGDEAGHRH
jgi:hypothetical protein